MRLGCPIHWLVGRLIARAIPSPKEFAEDVRRTIADYEAGA